MNIEQSINDIEDVFSLTIWLVISVNYFFIFFSRRFDKEQKYNLYFSIFSFSCFLFVFINSFFYKINLYLLNDTIMDFHPVIEMSITLLMFFFLSKFFYYFLNMPENYNKTFYFALLFNLLAIIISSTSLIFSFPEYNNHFFISAMISTGLGIIIILASIFFYLLKSKLYKKSLYRNIFSLILFVIMYTFIEKILLITQNKPLFLSSSFIIGPLILVISNFIASKFNNEYKELVDLKNSLELKVEERTKELKEANEQRTNYFINLAHETKTPLTIINNYLDSYIKEFGNNPKLEIIKNSIKKLTSDMINFLDVQKFDKDLPIYNHETIINISEILKEKLVLIESTASLSNIMLTYNIIDGLFINADPYAINRIVNNMISNSLKFTEAGGEIHIKLERESDKIVLTIQDTGIGIEKENLNNIFKPYFQISHNKRNIEGIGIGLYITKKIIDSLNGRIEVSSTIGNGSIFKIFFNPSVQETSFPSEKLLLDNNIITQNPFNKESFDSSYSINKKNLLIVEDNNELLKYLKDELCSDFNILTATNGIKAIEKLNTNIETDLIISDIMMDEMDGHELLDKIKNDEKYQGIPLIFLTAKNKENEKLSGLGKGAVDYITKPFSIEELKVKIKSLIGFSDEIRKKDYKKVTKMIQNEFFGEKDKISKSLLKLEEFDLTVRQKEIIKQIKDGLEYKQIALNMNISIKTVKKHVELLFKKMNVKNKIELLNKIFS